MAVKGISVNVVTCNTLLCGFIVGKLKEATNFLNEIVLKTINPSVYTYNDALCKKGKVKEAKSMITVMMKSFVIPDIRKTWFLTW